MSADDDDELPLSTLDDLFRKGFTIPEQYRMNSVYGKMASDLGRKTPPGTVGLVTCYLIAQRARTALRVI